MLSIIIIIIIIMMIIKFYLLCGEGRNYRIWLILLARGEDGWQLLTFVDKSESC
jgi:hypothetical protein